MSADAIGAGRATLGIEFGSTRIKACLVGDDLGEVLATGSHEWENALVDGYWTYPLGDVWGGVQAAYADLAAKVEQRFGLAIESLRAIGVSAMMHGYLAFDADGGLLVPFRTWRNTTTASAADELSVLFGVAIPQRWSIAHLHQAVRDGEPHVPRIRSITTLAGVVHERLTGRRVLGVGDASGMFPIDPATRDYDARLLARYDQLVAGSALPAPVRDLLPDVLVAGQSAGELTADGAALLDPTGRLRPGAVFCPPEGDAGTGMVATGAVAPRTGNVSVGTSVFAMIVLERRLRGVHPGIDLVTTPAGDEVAMVHCNNGASELGAWAAQFSRFAVAAGLPLDPDAVFATLLREAVEGEADAGGVLAYNQLAGEPVVGLGAGRPLVVRTPDSAFTLANVARAQVYGVFASLRLGMQPLTEEGVVVVEMAAHGGLLRTEGVGQRFLAAALDVPVTVAATASEGGAWGIALLAAFTADGGGIQLDAFLRERAFAGAATHTVAPDPADVAGFATYLERYRRGLVVERVAAEVL